MNRWNIPPEIEQAVLLRDRRCIYCGIAFENERARRPDRASWEHIVNDARIVTLANIARCCIRCNASKGRKSLVVWLRSAYCISRGIQRETIAAVARASLDACSSPS